MRLDPFWHPEKISSISRLNGKQQGHHQSAIPLKLIWRKGCEVVFYFSEWGSVEGGANKFKEASVW